VFGLDLVIRGLGYFSTGVLENISQMKTFFVSRLQSAVPVFTAQGKPLCFKTLHHQMQIEKAPERTHKAFRSYLSNRLL
jgi:hypothetical protein